MANRTPGDEALLMLSHLYYRIIKVNLTKDSHEELKDADAERTAEMGYSEKISDWFKGFAHSEYIHPDDAEKYLLFSDIDSLRKSFHEGKKYICCYYRRKMDNDFRWVCMELIPAQEYSHDNQIVYLYIRDIHDGFMTDIEEKDFLTRGLNRRGFLSQGKIFLETADRGKSYSVLFFNIKGFKAINEFFGTRGGDDLLRTIYQHLRKSSLKPILIARSDGDHFYCLINDENLNYDILPELCKITFTKDNKSIRVYARCGIYNITDYTVSISTMCDYAKLAISHIFDEYLKPYAVFDDEMRLNYILHSEIQGQVHHALENREFEVYYQPIVDAHTGEITSAEALIRWIHPEQGVISPGVFIPVLEESGRITQVDNFVLNEVLSFQKTRKKAGKKIVPISINLSWMDFYDTKMMDTILEELRNGENNLQARFEVTETSYAALSDNEENMISQLREAGAEVLLDDFGSGYSSFSTFSDYDFDIVKLDMGFVQKIGEGGKIKSIIHSIIDMSHHMDAKVIAEGVETQGQLDFLHRHDCDYIQGYFFSRPLPKKDFVDVLENGLPQE